MRTSRAVASATVLALAAVVAIALAVLGIGEGAGDEDATPSALATPEELAARESWLQAEGRSTPPSASHGEREGQRTLRTADLGSGVVVGLDGAPVPGATILLYTRETQQIAAAVPQEASEVLNLFPQAQPSGSGQALRFEFVLHGFEAKQAPPATLGAQPVGATSEQTITQTTAWHVLREWRANGEGHFDLEDLPEGELLLDAHDGARSLAAPLSRAEIEAAPPGGLRLCLAPGVALTGTVRDGAGTPIAAVDVTCAAVAWDDGRVDPVAQRTAITDASGAYRIEGLRMGSRCQPRFARESFFSPADPDVLEIQRDERFDHTMLAHATLAGVVREGGVPRADVELELRGFGVEKSDAEGRFSFRPRIDGEREVELFARSADQQLLGYLKLKLAPAERREDVVVALERACIVRGRVTDETGRAIAGARVSLSWNPAQDSVREEIAMGDLSRHVELMNWAPMLTRARAGSYAVRARKMLVERVVASRPIQLGNWIRQSQEGGGITISLDGGSFFRGLDTGSLLVGQNPEQPASVFEEQRSTETDGEGRFEFLGVWAGRYRLSASHQEHLAGEDRDFAVAPGDEHQTELMLPRGAKVAGVVLGPEGTASPQATVIAVRDADEIARVETDAEGRFAFVGLAPGALDLVGNDSSGASVGALRGLSLEHGTEIADLVLRFGVGASLFGRVLDGMGAPIPNAEVNVQSHVSSSSQSQASAGADGSYSLERLLHGEHGVAVSAEGYLPLNVESLMIDGALRRDFTLERGGSIAGTIYGPTGSPMAGAQVFLFHGKARAEEHTESDGEGHYRFVGLQPGTFQLYVRADDYSSSVRASQELGLGQDIERLDLRMKPSGRVSGRVLDAEGRPLAGVSVNGCTEPGGQGRRDTTTGPDGRFELGRLYPDQYRIYAGDDPSKGVVIDATPGGELAPIELKLTP